MTDIVKQFNNMVGHIISINDDRDVTLLLLGLRDMWPKVRIEIERLRAAAKPFGDEAMTDIVERLRRRIEIAEQESRFGDAEDMRDAIDIVERLRADIKKTEPRIGFTGREEPT